MYRSAINFFNDWKVKENRKPLIVRGARQVGKTWLLKEFGANQFKTCHYFDFEKEKNKFLPLFSGDLNPQKIIGGLSLLTNKHIDIQNDLIIFDEVQNIPRALTALKYFYEEMPGLAICSAGSLLGIILSDASFPVGKVEFYTLRAMNFEEFLLNYGNRFLYDAYLEACKNNFVENIVHENLLTVLKEYYVVGGLPEIVSFYLANKEKEIEPFKGIREKQVGLLAAFMSDFSKHSGKVNALHITSVFEKIPLQLAQNLDGSVKRFRFKNVVKGKKGYSELSGPISWLANAELVIKVPICNKPALPLRAFTKENFFKLYLLDVGLLGAMLEIPVASILLGDYGTTKGFFVENFVASELLSAGTTQLYSWNERNSEIEFVIIYDGTIVPVEVKSGVRTKSKSLQQYLLKYNPDKAFVLSEKPFAVAGKAKRFVPLYLAGKLLSINF